MNQNKFPAVPTEPTLYDWMYHKTDKDIEMYRRLTEGHESILECAVGTGRLAIPLAQAGHTVHGIDYSETMLQQCRTNIQDLPDSHRDRIHLYHEDMRNFDLGQTFSFVFIPFASFTYLLTIADQQACLNALKRHLAEGGTMVIDFPTWEEATVEHWLFNDQLLRKEKQVLDPRTGNITELWTENRFDSATQVFEQNRHFRVYQSDGTLAREQVVACRLRIFFPGEFQLLLNTCGLELVEFYGDFDMGPFHHKSEVAVAVIKQL